MADLEAGKLTVVNFKLISQMVSNSGVAGQGPGYIGSIKQKKKNLTLNFFERCEMPDICNIYIYICVCLCT